MYITHRHTHVRTSAHVKCGTGIHNIVHVLCNTVEQMQNIYVRTYTMQSWATYPHLAMYYCDTGQWHGMDLAVVCTSVHPYALPLMQVQWQVWVLLSSPVWEWSATDTSTPRVPSCHEGPPLHLHALLCQMSAKTEGKNNALVCTYVALDCLSQEMWDRRWEGMHNTGRGAGSSTASIPFIQYNGVCVRLFVAPWYQILEVM